MALCAWHGSSYGLRHAIGDLRHCARYPHGNDDLRLAREQLGHGRTGMAGPRSFGNRMSSIKVCAMIFFAFFLPGLTQLTNARITAPAMSTDGKAIDQMIAYTLMIVALLVTYLLH
ncbi:Arabinogalactan peptide 20 [Platanthera guangdongensis]|uniref:Arabinogalactan peptide 20 n=1 Tax=Platanthera guangdongensis TaxID=2320717 RepID=A0ABR2MDS4_9ASPA